VWLASRLGRRTVEERCPGTNWTGGWLGPSPSLDELLNVELFFRCPVRNLVTISTELSRTSNTAVRTCNHTGISFEGNREITAFIHVLPNFPSVPYNMSLGISLLLKHTNELFWDSIFFPPVELGPTRAMASSFFRFLDHTHRSTTVGRTPVDE